MLGAKKTGGRMFQANADTAEVMPVSFETVLTETGRLQLWC
jgi:hypothetical protein